MKRYLRSLVRFFSHSTPRTISLFFFVTVITLTSTLLIQQPHVTPTLNKELLQLKTLEEKQAKILGNEEKKENIFYPVIGKIASQESTVQSVLPIISTPIVSSCGEITSSGNYQLSQDLENNAGYEYQDPMGPQKVCLYIHDVNNVNLDCQSHKITSKLDSGDITIEMNNVNNFTIRNCNLISDFFTLRLQSVIGGTIQNNTFSRFTQDTSQRGMVSVKNSSSIEISGNTFHASYRQGPDDPYTAPLLDTSSVNIHDNAFSMKDGVPFSMGNGINNTFSNNTVDGMWDGSIKTGTADQIGADDGPVFANQENLTVSNNSISNTWDCGIETLLLIKNSSFTNNKIVNAGYCGIGAWWNSSWVNNTVSGNIVNKSSYLFQFFYLRNTDIHEQNIYFQNNTFTNNKFSNRLNSSYMGDTQVYSSVFDYQTLINYGISPDIVKVGNNTFKDNDFDKTLQSPLMIPAGIAVDQGGNICKQVDESTHPLKCATGSSLTPTPTITPGATPTVTPISAPTLTPTTTPPSGINPTPTVSPTPTGAATPTPAPTSAPEFTINLDIFLPGIGGNPLLGTNIVPIHQTRTFTIQFIDNTGKTVKEIDTPLVFTNGSYKGTVPVADIPAGRYIIKVKTSNSLYKAIPGVRQLISGQTTTTPQITLITGNLDDANGSKNLLDLSDYNLMIANYGHGNNLDLTLSDLNDDGITESKDLNILFRGFAIRKGD